jgi:hypothetical protein
MSHETVFGIAWEIGLDTEQLTTDMNTPSIQTIMERNWTLPRELAINGTLRFIVGTELVPGVLRKKSHGVFNGI